MVNMNRLTTADRVAIVRCLCEGMSIRATTRITGFAKGTVLKLLADMGEVCQSYHDRTVRGLTCKRVQADEIWSFCYSKSKNVPDSMRNNPGVGSIWTWTAIDADTKLVLSYTCGSRDAETGYSFMLDVADRIVNRCQLTTDGHGVYLGAVENAFGDEVSYAMLVKQYGNAADHDSRYSPGQCVGCEIKNIKGLPDQKHVSTSFVERQNLTLRMSQRRFTRLTNAFSKKFENLCHAVALHFAYYNLCRVHSTTKVTPAVAAGLEGHTWSVEELVGLLAEREAAEIASGALKRGKYAKKAKNSD